MWRNDVAKRIRATKISFSGIPHCFPVLWKSSLGREAISSSPFSSSHTRHRHQMKRRAWLTWFSIYVLSSLTLLGQRVEHSLSRKGSHPTFGQEVGKRLLPHLFSSPLPRSFLPWITVFGAGTEVPSRWPNFSADGVSIGDSPHAWKEGKSEAIPLRKPCHGPEIPSGWDR